MADHGQKQLIGDLLRQTCFRDYRDVLNDAPSGGARDVSIRIPVRVVSWAGCWDATRRRLTSDTKQTVACITIAPKRFSRGKAQSGPCLLLQDGARSMTPHQNVEQVTHQRIPGNHSTLQSAVAVRLARACDIDDMGL